MENFIVICFVVAVCVFFAILILVDIVRRNREIEKVRKLGEMFIVSANHKKELNLSPQKQVRILDL